MHLQPLLTATLLLQLLPPTIAYPSTPQIQFVNPPPISDKLILPPRRTSKTSKHQNPHLHRVLTIPSTNKPTSPHCAPTKDLQTSLNTFQKLRNWLSQPEKYIHLLQAHQEQLTPTHKPHPHPKLDFAPTIDPSHPVAGTLHMGSSLGHHIPIAFTISSTPTHAKQSFCRKTPHKKDLHVHPSSQEIYKYLLDITFSKILLSDTSAERNRTLKGTGKSPDPTRNELKNRSEKHTYLATISPHLAQKSKLVTTFRKSTSVVPTDGDVVTSIETSSYIEQIDSFHTASLNLVLSQPDEDDEGIVSVGDEEGDGEGDVQLQATSQGRQRAILGLLRKSSEIVLREGWGRVFGDGKEGGKEAGLEIVLEGSFEGVRFFGTWVLSGSGGGECL